MNMTVESGSEMKISFKVITQKKTEVKEEQTSSTFSSLTALDEENLEPTKSNVICLEDGVIKE